MLKFLKHACQRNGHHLYMYFLKKHPKLSTERAAAVMSLHVQLVDAKGVMVVMLFGSLTKVMLIPLATFSDMWKFAGVLKQ